MKSIIQADKMHCFLCDRFTELDEHHIFNGVAYRSKSEKDGMKVYLCRQCHIKVHENMKKRIELKKMGQRVWEKTHGTREEFIDRYGKSYL